MLLSIIFLAFSSCGKESGINEKDDDVNHSETIFDLFPNYLRYLNMYTLGIIELENAKNRSRQIFSIDESERSLKETNDWRVPDDAPYIFVEFCSRIRFIRQNDLCYKSVLEKHPNILYYECIYPYFELENIMTGERRNFDNKIGINDAERLLRAQNPEWKIPDDAPYNFSYNNGLSFNNRMLSCDNI